MPAFIDITGHRYARLTVVRMNGRKDQRPLWLCRCDCGNEITVFANSLRQGNTRSCGCLAIQVRRKTGQANHKHGESKLTTNDQPSREYRAWTGLRERCFNPTNKDFVNYGGRGVTVCERWSSYENFLTDMGRCPPACSIDRINNNGNYEPGNCRWATSSEQNKNRRPLKRDLKGKYQNSR